MDGGLMLRLVRVLVVLSLCLSAGYVSAQETSELGLSDAQIAAITREAAEIIEKIDAEGLGYETMVGLLSSDETGSMDVTLRKGRGYAIMGVCDDSCSDIDISVSDPGGGIVEEDLANDDVPAVNVFPEADGVYTVQVFMAECESNPCALALVIAQPRE
jgi:hypothetical protein